MKTFQGKFKVGNRVKWDSSGKKKEGTVVAIVPALERVITVFDTIAAGNKYYSFSAYGGGYPRHEESYLVALDARPGRKMRPVYWPNASLLNIV